MPIIAKKTVRIPVPEGQYPAVCVDVIDRGMQHSEKWGKTEHKITIVWQLFDEDSQPLKGSNGFPLTISRWFTLSLHEKSLLRSVLTAWRGKAFTAAELKGFDVESLIGAGGLLQVIHNQGSNGDVYDNVSSVARLPKGIAKPDASGYIRFKDRPENATNGNGGASGHDEEDGVEFVGPETRVTEDADIPF